MPKMMSEACYRRLKLHDRLLRLMRRRNWDHPSYAAAHEQQVRRLADRYEAFRVKSRSPRDRATLGQLAFLTENYADLCAEVQCKLPNMPECKTRLRF